MLQKLCIQGQKLFQEISLISHAAFEMNSLFVLVCYRKYIVLAYFDRGNFHLRPSNTGAVCILMRPNPHVECTHAVLLYVTVVLGISVLVNYMEVTEICNWNFPKIFFPFHTNEENVRYLFLSHTPTYLSTYVFI